MGKYIVDVDVLYGEELEVEADSEAAAEALGIELLREMLVKKEMGGSISTWGEFNAMATEKEEV